MSPSAAAPAASPAPELESLGDTPWGLVISVEHASSRVPSEPGHPLDLGLPASELTGHRAWDPGAALLGRGLARITGAPLLLGQVSRLVVDLNRRESDPAVIPEVSFGLLVPGNVDLETSERLRRLARWHRPYRGAVEVAVNRELVARGRCLHLSVHSFTPELDGVRRDVEVGLLFDPARPLEVAWAAALGEALRGAGLDARDNEPYAGTAEGFTTFLRERHPWPVYAGLELELSQALLPQGLPPVTEVLASVLVGRCARPHLP